MSKERNGFQDERLNRLEDHIIKIQENHLPHLQEQLTKLSTDLEWLKKFFFIIATASIGSLIAGVLNLL